MRVIDDPTTLNKILYMRPPENMVSHNELIAMWERKTGRALQMKLIKCRVHHQSSYTQTDI